jgi:hypothetical protein
MNLPVLREGLAAPRVVHARAGEREELKRGDVKLGLLREKPPSLLILDDVHCRMGREALDWKAELAKLAQPILNKR